MNHIKKRSIIFIYDNNHLLSRILISSLHHVGKTHVEILAGSRTAISLLVWLQQPIEIPLKPCTVKMLRPAHIEMQHGMLTPFLLISTYLKTVKKFLPPLIIGMKS